MLTAKGIGTGRTTGDVRPPWDEMAGNRPVEASHGVHGGHHAAAEAIAAPFRLPLGMEPSYSIIYQGRIGRLSGKCRLIEWETFVLSKEDNERISLTHKGLKSGALEAGFFLNRPGQGRITEHALKHFHKLLDDATKPLSEI